MRERFPTFCEVFCDIFEVFLHKFFEVFGLAQTCLDAFGPVQMHLDAFECVLMHSDALGRNRKNRKFAKQN